MGLPSPFAPADRSAHAVSTASTLFSLNDGTAICSVICLIIYLISQNLSGLVFDGYVSIMERIGGSQGLSLMRGSSGSLAESSQKNP
jgi:hypothetical protein